MAESTTGGDPEAGIEEFAFELPNVGPGPDPLSLAALAADNDFVVIVFQRDHYCTNCREQVRDLKTHYGQFRARDAEVVSVVPEPRAKVAEWQDSYDLPYPLLADPGATAGEDYGQPVRFGILGRVSDLFGRMPEAVVLDTREGPDGVEVVYVHRGSSTFDRPAVEELIEAIDGALSG